MAKPGKEQLRAELWRRAIESCTAEAIADGYPQQQEVMESDAQNLIVLGSRQIGKDVLSDGMLWLTSSRCANVESLFLAMVGEQAFTHWRTKWKPFLRKYKIPCVNSEANMMTTFPNGSVVRFAGMDDTAHVETYLGGSMAGGICVLNELQSCQVDLQDLVERILEPALNQTTAEKSTPGRMLLMGTFPTLPVGYFWALWKRGAIEVNGDWAHIDRTVDDGYARFTWSRMDNPHLTDNEGALQRTLKKLNTTIHDIRIRKDWLGQCVFDSEARAFHPFSAKNVYQPTPPPWLATANLPPGKLLAAVASTDVDFLAVGADPASLQDRFALVLWGWSTKKKMPATQLAEWVTAQGADPLQSQWIEVIKFLLDKYGAHLPRYLVYDASGAQSTLDFMYRNTQMLIHPALKGPGSLKAGVDRFNDILARRECLVMAGSALEEDLTKAKWSTRESDARKFTWASDWHPDVADAGRYGLEKFIQSSEVEKEDLSHLTANERTIRLATEEAARSFKALYEQPVSAGPSRPGGASSSLYRR